MKTIFSHLLNLSCTMWQDRIVCSSRLLPQILLKPLETCFFLHSDLRTLFSQSDRTIFLAKKVMLQILTLGHFTSGLSRGLFILQTTQQNLWMFLLIQCSVLWLLKCLFLDGLKLSRFFSWIWSSDEVSPWLLFGKPHYLSKQMCLSSISIWLMALE